MPANHRGIMILAQGRMGLMFFWIRLHNVTIFRIRELGGNHSLSAAEIALSKTPDGFMYCA